MRRLGFILLTGICLLVFVVPVSAQEIPDFNTDSLSVDSFAIDSFDPDPEWYVAPLVREADFAPRRAAAANCPVDSVLTFNVDSILSEVTVYEYGDTTRTMVWTVNADGSRVGKSRTESASTANTSYSATYAWDAATNDWKGTSKEEHTYNSANKETLRILYNTWLNNDWLADTKYTWVYDASNREHEYTTYTRNTSTNELVLSQQRIREWYNNTKLTLEIQYTAHNGTTWSAGTKKVYDYDASGNQIEYTYYSSLSNGNWVGSSHEKWTYTSGKKTYYEKQTWSNGGWSNSSKEIWAYNGPSAKQILYEKYTGSGSTWTGSSKEIWEYTTSGKQTLHEKYSWSSSDWSLTLQENSGYDAAGNNNLVENYNVSNGTFTGSKKEAYTYNAQNKKNNTYTYKWTNGEWVYNQWSVSEYDAAGNATETCKYNWKNEAWVGTGTRTLQTFNSNKKVTEKITQSWPTNATYWINKTCTTTVYSGANVTQEAYYTWQNEAWLGTKRSDYHYNAKNQNDTTKTYTNDGTDWIYSNRTVKTFNAAGTNIMTHNAKWQNDAWVMTSMTRTDISDITVDGIRRTLNASWRCGTDSVWIGVEKDTTVYSSTGNTLYFARYTSWANDDWVPSYWFENIYDEADRTLSEQRYDWKNNNWQGRYWYVYQYDERGNRTSYAVYSGWNGTYNNWNGSTKVDNTYNSNDMKESEILYTWQNNDWLPLFSYHYAYDDLNHEIDKIVMAYNDGTWSNSTHSVKEYKGSQLVKSYEYKWLNSQWTLSSLSESYYDEDAQAKLRRTIEGRWNNGNLTSFTDKLYSYACDPRYYTIRFVNYDGTELSAAQIEEGHTPVYDGEEPSKQEDPEFTYAFAGWNPSVVPVTGNATYTATFTSNKRSYTVTWLNEDGSEISHETLEYGATPMHADVTKENTAEFTYAFNGWTPGIGIVTGDASYTATFSATKNSYTITWLNEDGSEIEHKTLEYGATPVHADMTKENTAEYTYAFAGWTPQIVTVTGDASYTASFTATKNKYTIIFLNYDGTELQSSEVEYGVTPNYEGATPTKPADAQDTYTFAGWDTEIIPVTGTKTYTATFTGTKNSYTITWLNDDNTLIDQTTVEYGAMPQHEAATKENTAEWTYAFTGWSPAIVSVTGDATYTATFSATKNKYTITWLNEDGSEISHETLEYGATPSHVDPTKEATDEFTYTFAGWTPAIVDVVGNASYQATFSATKNSYTITWLNEDGSEIEHETLEYGATPAHADMTKENTAEYTYAFTGWTPQIVTVTGDASYTASFTATKNKYTIIFLNYDGTELQSSEVEYGVTPNYEGAIPTKPADAQDTYTFAGWDQEIIPVAGTKTYTATFTGTKNSYTITWLNDDNTLIDQTTVEYGAMPQHEAATKENTAEWTYAFTGWTPQIESVIGNASYTATFSATKNKYTITWLNEDGSEISHETLEYGVTPSHVDPTKEATDECTYTFAGWNPAVTSVTGDASYTATFSASKNSYTVTWLNEDGSEIEHETLEYGATPAHADVTKENTAGFTYTFTGWTPAIVSITGDASYTATFSATKNKYTITWLDDDNTQIDQTTVEYGVIPTHDDPTKAATAEFTYTFAGWDNTPVAVTGPATYKATYTSTKNKYTITWLDDDNSSLGTTSVEYGEIPTHANPTKQATAEYTYTFSGWNVTPVAVTGPATYKATYTSAKNSYTITWLDDDNSSLGTTSVEYGVVPTHDNPTKQATAEFTYTFAGWDNTPIAVTGEATYKATYTSAKNSYTITWLDEDDSSLGTSTVEYGIVPTHEDPTKQPTAQYGYTFAGWSPAISAVTANATYKATYTDTINQYTISWLDDVGTLVDQTKVAYGSTPAHANIYKESDSQYDYTFVGWTPTLVPVTGDASYSAIFTTAGKSYTVTFYFEDGVTILDQMTLPYGAIPSTPYIPSRPSDANHTYTFSGWSPEIAPVTGDISYVPTFTAIPNQYTVIFRNYNGKELQRKKVDYGTIPEYEGDEPSRPATNSYTWAFEGWTPELTAVIGDATYTAVYTKVMNTYTILFYDEDGTTLLDEVTVEHGQKPTTSVIPTKEADEEYRYTFAGWSPKIAKATADAEYTATYMATPKTQDLNNTEAEGAAIKVIIEDKIYIRRGGNIYSIDGQRVK